MRSGFIRAIRGLSLLSQIRGGKVDSKFFFRYSLEQVPMTLRDRHAAQLDETASAVHAADDEKAASLRPDQFQTPVHRQRVVAVVTRVDHAGGRVGADDEDGAREQLRLPGEVGCPRDINDRPTAKLLQPSPDFLPV